MENEPSGRNDVGPTGVTVAKNIQRVRKAQNLSLKDLAERLARHGRKIGLSSLSKIENGDRRVDVDDLIAIALALDVSPLGLLLPRGNFYEIVEVTGGVGSLPLIWKWGRGEQSLQFAGDEREFAVRSVPSWINTEGEAFDPKPQPSKLELGFADAGSSRVVRFETHEYGRGDGKEYLFPEGGFEWTADLAHGVLWWAEQQQDDARG
jgi:transcriptional regulator with XRE-family HTH domain